MTHIFDEVRTCAALRNIATQLSIDGNALVDRWRKRTELLVSMGKKAEDAAGEAFHSVTDEARRKREAIDRFNRGRKAKR